MPLPEHSFAAGMHVPAHAPSSQTWLTHAAGSLHTPLALQVWTPLPVHRVVIGVHVPAQAPLTHAWLVQAAGVPHPPVASQVATAFCTHVVAFGVHGSEGIPASPVPDGGAAESVASFPGDPAGGFELVQPAAQQIASSPA